jgi:hypothetical protein
MKVKTKILGVPLTYEDEVTELSHFHFGDKQLLNNFGHVEKEKRGSNELIVRVHVDLMRILTITSYFSIRNILAKLGGYKALIDPIIGLFIPFFVLSYLHKLARIIKQRRMKEYLN